ncbi:MAG: glycosyltransferase family 9 protein [Bacteroidetes bacterium]|nr:glycosyltransferase family 9 protein [Bacteroidota bacterium]
MKFLLLRFSSIGDIVLTSPVIRCLKKQVPGAEVHFLTKKSFEAVTKHNPYLDKTFLFEERVHEVLDLLKEENYDAVIDLHHNFRTLKLKRALGVPSHSFNKLNIEKWMAVNFKTKSLPNKHIVDRYLETVSSFGVKNDGEGLDYFITPDDEKIVTTLPSSFQPNYIAWVIGAKHATKQLPLSKMISIAGKLKMPVVILGGKEDMMRSKEIISHFNVPVFDGCGNFSLNQSAAIVKHAHHVITHDTGLMHIAAAFRKKIISVWGNTIPEFGMYPYLPAAFSANNKIVEIKNLSCRPCSKIGFDKCPKGHFKCMNLLPEEEVVNTFS